MTPKLGKALTQDEGVLPTSPRQLGLWSPDLAAYWSLCGYYGRGLRRRKFG